MASRSIRSDVTLSFGLVNVNVAIKKLSEDPRKGTELKMGSPDGNPVKQRYIDETTGALYEPSEVLRGIYDDPKNGVGFHPVSTEAVAAIDAACEIDGLVIDSFVPLTDFPVNRVESTYFISPEGGPKMASTLAMVRDAIATEKVAGIGKCTLSKRQRPFALYVTDEGALVLALLTFAVNCEAREQEAQAALEGVATDPKHIELARTLVQSMIGATELNDYTDDSIPQRESLIIAAANGETITVPEAVASAPVIDLEAALLASIGGSPKAQAGKKAAPKKVAAKAA